MRLIRDGEKGGKGVWRWGKREIIYLSLHCHHQNDFCIKMGSDESHFNVSLIVSDKVNKTVSTNHNLLKRKESRSGIEPRSFRLPAYRLTARPNQLSVTPLKMETPFISAQLSTRRRRQRLPKGFGSLLVSK